jgi:hypothetical protein
VPWKYKPLQWVSGDYAPKKARIVEWLVIGKAWLFAKEVAANGCLSLNRRICCRGGTGSLHFLSTFKTFGAFIHFRISMLTAIMTGTFATGHKTHTDPTPFPAHITVFFSFGFWHLASPSS